MTVTDPVDVSMMPCRRSSFSSRTHDLTDGADGVRQPLVTDMRDGMPVRLRERDFAKVASDAHHHRLTTCVSDREQRLDGPTCHVFRDPPWQFGVVRRGVPKLLDGQQLQARVRDRLGVPLVGAGEVGCETDQLTRACVADGQLPPPRCQEEHSHEAGSEERDFRGLTGAKDVGTGPDMHFVGTEAKVVVPHAVTAQRSHRCGEGRGICPDPSMGIADARPAGRVQGSRTIVTMRVSDLDLGCHHPPGWNSVTQSGDFVPSPASTMSPCETRIADPTRPNGAAGPC